MNTIKPRNWVTKDLRSSKYRMRVAVSKKHFNRVAEKVATRKELVYAGNFK